MQNVFKFLFVLPSLFFGIKVLARPLSASLVLAERTSLAELADNVMNPDSPRHQIYYTPEEIRDLVAPKIMDYTTALRNLRSQGFSIAFQSPSHLLITVKADHKVFEKVFNTKFKFIDNKYHVVLRRPKIPSNLSLISSISGLSNIQMYRPLYKKFSEGTEFVGQPGILPEKIKKAYGLNALYNSGLTGKGQHIAIATFMNFFLEDISQYFELIGLSPTPSVEKITFNGTPPFDDISAPETELDAELAGMIAPGASLHVFTSAENSEQGELTLFTTILDDNRSKIISYSWGMCETSVSPDHRVNMDKVFARAIAQGVNILAASGDTGSDGCTNGTAVAVWPAIHPSVLSVGGTSLYFSQDGSKQEVGWSGSGGGVSAFYNLPTWQSVFKTPFLRRSYPDFAFNADPGTGQGIWIRSSSTSAPGWIQVGGTSIGAPQWAGYLALVNESRIEKELPTLGYLNPILYNSSPNDKRNIFTDVIKGRNGAYAAGEGWDAVTGWGTMKASEMLDFLIAR